MQSIVLKAKYSSKGLHLIIRYYLLNSILFVLFYVWDFYKYIGKYDTILSSQQNIKLISLFGDADKYSKRFILPF
jgi:hypothetical protein